MTQFAGLDVSLEETKICAVDERGRLIPELRAASEPLSLIAALTGLGLPLECEVQSSPPTPRADDGDRGRDGEGSCRDLRIQAWFSQKQPLGILLTNPMQTLGKKPPYGGRSVPLAIMALEK